ncbi:hypothetical protein M569_04414 [Genlisea aurea]|uniref:Uncharacterized protein n=1 Tax=Genlisea aurea TaxID=192259 RepID=S8E3V5_9LAMI|nr:hypothetical protein M569_04414 [Genlisea aurea]
MSIGGVFFVVELLIMERKELVARAQGCCSVGVAAPEYRRGILRGKTLEEMERELFWGILPSSGGEGD